MSTNRVKFDDAGNDFTAWCLDNTGTTEIGPSKWDNANRRFELNCDATDFQVKFDNATRKFEARNVSDDCCDWLEGACCGDDCGVVPKFIQLVFSGVVRCGPSSAGCNCNDVFNTIGWDCNELNTTFILESVGGCTWKWIGVEQCLFGGFGEIPEIWFIIHPAVDDLYEVLTFICDSADSERCFWALVEGDDDSGCGMCDGLPVTLLNEATCGVTPSDRWRSDTGQVIVSIP